MTKPTVESLNATALQRRNIIKSLAALALWNGPLSDAIGAALGGDRSVQSLGPAQPFDYAWLKGQARSLASQRYRDVSPPLPDAVKNLTWDEYQAIRYKPEHALWAMEQSRFRVKFFHLGLYFQRPVRMHEVAGGQAREIAYDRSMFDYGKLRVRGALGPKDLGFAGFRVNFHTDWERDFTAFLGASYFRAVGSEMQYGLSARGLAIDCGMNRPEEFPMFTAFWLERPEKLSGRLTVYA